MPDTTIAWACVDSSVVLALVTRPAANSPFATAWRRWHLSEMTVAAPSLLMHEVQAALRRYVEAGYLEPDEAADALEAAFGLDVKQIDDPEIYRRALNLSEELDLPGSVSTTYLALAQFLGAELWTADRRLVQTVGKRLPWLHLLQD